MKRFQICLFAIVTLFAFASPVWAFDSGWVRLTPDELFDYQITKDGIRINNFNLAERKSFSAKGLTVLKLTLSAANRREKAVQLSVQLVGLDEKDKILFAVTARPSFSRVGAKRTEEVKGDIYILPGEGQKAKTLLLRVVGAL